MAAADDEPTGAGEPGGAGGPDGAGAPAGPLAGRRVAVVAGISTGGIAGHVRLLVAGLVTRGATVTVLAPADTVDRLRSGPDVAAAAVDIGSAPRPRQDAAAVLRLRGLLRQADVVHAHGLRAGLLAGLALGPRRAGRTPLVVTWHNAVLGEGPKRRAYAVLEAAVARLADVTLGASSDLVDRVRGLGGVDVRLGPVTAPPAPPAVRPPADVREELGVDARPLLLVVSRLAPQKGHPLLLDAAARWSHRSDRPMLVVAGDGPLLGELRHRVGVEGLDVAYVGHRSDVPNLIGAADVVVLPSVWEARSLVAQEALRAGVPLVATAVGGIPELVGDAALLVPYGDPDALARAVARVLDDPALAARLAAAGRDRAAGWPTVEDGLDLVASLYRELTPAPRPR